MALIVEQHVVADMYPVGTTAISAGMPLIFDTDGNVIPATAAATTVIGIAGDSFLTAAGQTTAYSAEVVIGANSSTDARTRWTSNRVSDMYNETLASGKMTVYHGGGKFWISDDLLVGEGTMNAGELVIAAAGGQWIEGATAGQVIGLITGVAQQYPSGVPGTDTPDGSIAIGTETANNRWVPISLRI